MLSPPHALPLRPITPPAYPLIGHLPFVFDLLGGATRLRAAGDLVQLRLLSRDVYVVNHPREIEELLVEKHVATATSAAARAARIIQAVYTMPQTSSTAPSVRLIAPSTSMPTGRYSRAGLATRATGGRRPLAPAR